MANYANLKSAIQQVIKTNGNKEITGALLQQSLLAMIDSLGAGYQFVGGATPTTNPGTPDQNVFYLAGTPGAYSNFDGFNVEKNQVVAFTYNGSWSHTVLFTVEIGLETAIQYGKNLLNPDTTPLGYIDKRNGDAVALTSGAAHYTDFMPIDSRGLWIGSLGGYGVVGGYAVYDKDFNFIRGGSGTTPGSIAIEYQPGDAWVRSTVFTYTGTQQVNAGTEFDAPVVPYVPPVVYITTENFKILSDQILDGAISTQKLADKAVTMDKLEPTITVRSKNLLNTATIVHNKFISASGGVAVGTNLYGYFPYIEVEPETSYHISNANDNAWCNRSDFYIAFYNANKVFISSIAANVTNITTPALCKYVQISLVMARVTQPQMELGTTRTTYEEYFAPKLYIDPERILFPDNGVTTSKIANGAVTQDKIANNVIVPSKPFTFGSFRNSGVVAVGQSLTTTLVRVTKNTRIVARVNGTIESVEIGVGRNTFYGRWVVVTPTKITVKYGESGATVVEYEHGLTLGTLTKVIISKNVAGSAIIRLIDDYGNTYTSPSVSWAAVVGPVFAYNGNASTGLNVDLSFMVADLTRDVWLFGDSYFSFYDPARWLYYPIQWGFTSFLIDAMGGESATQSFSDLQNLLSTGAIPSFIVWCLGMNGGTDSGGAVNPTWLSITTQLETICAQYGITLILATIPTIPGASHAALNSWVRNSGHRYIDFAAAVEDENTTYWRGWGTANALLSSDEVHPTSHGAVELALRALLDFPEMTIKED